MMKPNVKLLGVKSYQFPLQGGPFHKQKHRIEEPLPLIYSLPWGQSGQAHYRKTDRPERKLWPVMYVYDEVMSDDKDRSRIGRTRRLERLTRAILYGPSEWYAPDLRGPSVVRKTAQSKEKGQCADIHTTRRAGNG